jgi:hypothetical protein
LRRSKLVLRHAENAFNARLLEDGNLDMRFFFSNAV